MSTALAATAGCGASSVPVAAESSNAAPRNDVTVVGTPVPPSISARRAVKPLSLQAGVNYVYIADQSAESIDIFPLQASCASQAASITDGIDGPYGLWYDTKSQSLIVANQSNNTVTVYSNGSSEPTLTYSQGLDRPLYPIVDQNENLYVGNGGNGTIVEYLAGSTTVSRVLQTPGTETDGLAFDQQGDLFAAFRNSFGGGSIIEFPAGSSVGTELGMSLAAPQGVVVDANGNTIVVETEGVNRVDVFEPGSTTPLFDTPIPSFNIPTEPALDSADAHLYISTLEGTTYGVQYPLAGQVFFVQDQEAETIQGLAISNGQSF